MLIRGVSTASINPAIYRQRLLDLANYLYGANLAVCMIMLQLLNTLLIKTAGGEFTSLDFFLSGFCPASLESTFMYSRYVLMLCSQPWLPLTFWPRLLCPLHLGLPVLWVPDTLQHDGGAGLVWRLHVRGLLLLLLLHRRTGRWLQLPLRHGLRHHGRLLRVLGLPGNLHGVLRNLLPNIERPGLTSVFGTIHPEKKNGRKWLLCPCLIQKDEVSVWERRSVCGWWRRFSVNKVVQCGWVEHVLNNVLWHWASLSSNSTYMKISASVNSSFLLRLVSFA